jgi:glycosyltransferase involved in cell wall biosynthesis
MLLENNPYPQDIRVREEAQSLVSAGYRVTVVAPRTRRQPRRDIVEGVEVSRFRLPGANGGSAALLVEFLVATLVLHLAALRALASGADVLHLHNPPDTLFPAGWMARLLGRRVIFDHHDLTPELVASRTEARWAIAAARWCERQTFRAACLVLAANRSYGELAQARGGKRAEQVIVVRNGPRARSLSPGIEIRSGVLDDPHLVYVGALAPQDHVQDLPAVLALLRDRHRITRARLTIVGDGPAREAVMAEAVLRAVSDRIAITGWLDPADVQPIMREADVCVDPARPTPLNDQSTMIKIAEYLAAGRATVAYDLTETRRTAADAALLVKGDSVARLADGIAGVARDEQLRKQMSARAQRRASELTWEHSERHLLRAYEVLCGGSRRG